MIVLLFDFTRTVFFTCLRWIHIGLRQRIIETSQYYDTTCRYQTSFILFDLICLPLSREFTSSLDDAITTAAKFTRGSEESERSNWSMKLPSNIYVIRCTSLSSCFFADGVSEWWCGPILSDLFWLLQTFSWNGMEYLAVTGMARIYLAIAWPLSASLFIQPVALNDLFHLLQGSSLSIHIWTFLQITFR